MKIGYDAKRFYHNNTGLGNYSRDLIRVLSKYFPANKYVLYNPKKSDKNIQLQDCVVEVRPHNKLFKLIPSLWRQKGIVKQLILDKMDVFHGLSGELPKGIDKTKIKSVVTIHDLIFVRYPKLYSFIDRKIHFYKFKRSAKIADIVIAISEQTKQDIIDFLKINPNKIKVLYQGCSNIFKKEFSDFEKKNIKQKYNLPNNFLLNVGTIEERKNLFTIVKAIKNTKDSLVVVGNDKSEYAKKIKAYIKTNKMEHRIYFLKNVSTKELAIIYQMAEIFIYPSIFEGFGIPIIEALYSKTPVITSLGSCFSEAGGKYTTYINPKDEKALEESILKIKQNPEQTKKNILKGFEFVQKFNDQQIAENMINIYKNLL